jgi:ankyrin repeat protein
MSLLVSVHTDHNVPTRDRRETIIHIAVCKHNDMLLRQILTSQVKLAINTKNKDDHSGLFIAACMGDYKECKLLLEYSADVDVRCEVLTEHANVITTLHTASYRGHDAIVKLLIAAGAEKTGSQQALLLSSPQRSKDTWMSVAC